MRKYDPVEEAYRILLKVQDNPDADFDDASFAIEEAIGYLGEALDS